MAVLVILYGLFTRSPRWVKLGLAGVVLFGAGFAAGSGVVNTGLDVFKNPLDRGGGQ